MAFGPEHSAIRITPDIQKALEAASFEEIKDIMRQAQIDQNLVQVDSMNPDVLIPTDLADNAPKRFAQTVTDPKTGEKIIFEGESEIDVARQSNAYMREHFSQPVAESATPQPRAANGQFIERLQEAIEEVAQNRTIQSWADATEEFKNSPAGSDWPGGDANLHAMGLQLVSMGLIDATDKTAALVAAYRHLKENGQISENPDVAEANSLADAISKCQRPEDLRSLLVAKRSGDWGSFVG